MLVNLKRRKSRLRRRVEFFGALAALGAVIVFFEDIRAPIRRWHQAFRATRTTPAATPAAPVSVAHNAALFALQAAGQNFPLNPPAWELAATTLEILGAPEALRLRQQAAAYQRDVPAATFALVATALRARDLAAAENALATLPPSAATTAEHLQFVAALALAQRREADAATALAQLASAETYPARQRLRRSTAQLFAADSTVAVAGKAELTQLAASAGPTQAPALRELALLAAATGAAEEATAHARALVRAAPDDLSAHLLLVSVLRRQSLDTREAEQAAARLGAVNADNAVSFSTWQLVHGRAIDARAWLDALPVALRATASVRAVFAECLAAQRQWDALATQLSAGAWGSIPSDALTLAFSAHRLEERKRAELRAGIWQEAISSSAKDASGLRILARLALYWDWQDEAARTLIALARTFRSETWAAPALVALAAPRKDSSALPEAYGVWRELQPDNRAVAALWAFASLLNDPSLAPTSSPAILARELYTAAPADPIAAAAHALTLYHQQKTKDAVALLENLPPAARQFPQPALVLGVGLLASGDANRAAPLLKIAERAPLSFFERKFLEEAIVRAESRVRRLPATKTDEFRPQRRPGQQAPMPARQEPAKPAVGEAPKPAP